MNAYLLIQHHILFMFLSPNRDIRQVFLNPSPSLERSNINKSTHLPYFKRFPHNKYHSQQRKRFQKVDNKPHLSNNYLVSPERSNSHRKGSFFKPKKPYNHEKGQMNKFVQIEQNQFLRRNESNKKKLLRRIQNLEQKKIIKQKTQTSKQRFKSSVIVSRGKPSINKTLPEENIQKENLKKYEKEEILKYTEIYYYGQHCSKKYNELEDLTKSDGGYNWLKGDHVHYRYELLQLLGQGSFGEVFKCFDHKTNCWVALKMVKKNEKYTKQAKIQIKLLNFIKAKDPTSSKNCVHIKDFFMFRDRICLTFELMSINLYQLIKSNGFYGLPLDLIRRISLQILNALYFLHKNSLIHADLKPENVLLKEPNKSGIRVIDFGSSCYESQTIYTYIQSRYYRAPQVILGLPYNRKIDIWSFACIIAELHLGYPLFAGDDENQQMYLLVHTLGAPASSLSNSAKRWFVFFDKNHSFKIPKKEITPHKCLEEALENPQDKDFINFLKMCFEWVPQKRCEAIDCLKHQWILKGLPEEIRNQHLKFIEEQEQKLRSSFEKEKRSFLKRENKLLF